MADNPRVSIVLPVWNGERYLAGALKSIVCQTYSDFELIIVNDCSTDSSAAIAEDFARRDERIRVLHNEQNLKLPASLNRGFSVARGRYFTWTSDDNLLHDDFLEALIAEIERNGADLVFSDFNSIDEHGAFLNVSPAGDPDDLMYVNTIGASFLYKCEVHQALAGFDVKRFCYEDYDFWVRAYLAGFKFYRSTRIVYDYRRHPGSLTSQLKKPPAGYIDYVYDLRTRFTLVSAKTAFEGRRALIGSWLALGPRRSLRVCGEALMIDPMATARLFVERTRALPTRVTSMLRSLASRSAATHRT